MFVDAAAHAIRGFGKQRQRTADIADQQHRQQQPHDNDGHRHDKRKAPDIANNAGEVLHDILARGIAEFAGFGKQFLGAEYGGKRCGKQDFARFLKIAVIDLRHDVGRALMQGVMHVLNLAEQRRKRRNFAFQLAALGTVEPLAESAFRGFRRHRQGLFPLFEQIALHAYGPMQVADFRGEQSARLGRFAQEFGIFFDIAQRVQQQPHGCQKGTDTGAKNHIELVLDGNINPTH